MIQSVSKSVLKQLLWESLIYRFLQCYWIFPEKLDFKPLYERAPFAERPVDRLFYQPKVRKNEMAEQVALSTNRIHEKDSVALLNHSTKGAMIGSFCREYFP